MLCSLNFKVLCNEKKNKQTTTYLLMKSLWRKNRKNTLIERMDLKLEKICQDKSLWKW